MDGPRSPITSSKEYASFRASVTQKKIVVELGDQEYIWRIYDFGPRDVRCPLVCLPPVSGTADVFFYQLMGLCCQGYRVISIDYPVLWSHEDFCEAFLVLLDQLRLDEIHLYGASLGGFLAQKFAQYTRHCQRVQTLILNNAFTDTAAFTSIPSPTTLRLMPAFMLKRLVLGSYPQNVLEANIANSVDFMVERLDLLTRGELASRLVLNVADGYVEPQHIAAQNIKVMLIDALDHSAITQSVREELYKCYPQGRIAELKDGGNFPYLSRPDQVNLFIQLHLRAFEGTRYSARDDFTNDSPASTPTLQLSSSAKTPPRQPTRDLIASPAPVTLQSEDEDDDL
eukprot:m.79289 g.79289  ORF g.79289 m.79289 type:complete len:341 (-) comp7998_c0_seq1:435-1457(-)